MFNQPATMKLLGSWSYEMARTVGDLAANETAPAELKSRMAAANAKLGKSRVGIRALKAKIAELRIQLEDDPRYREILKLQRKIKVLKTMEREADVEMSVYSDEIIKSMGKRTSDYFDEIIGDPPPSKSRRIRQ